MAPTIGFVVATILDYNGNCMVEYTYDAWGKLLNTVDNSGINLGSINPLRYRGYYYDQETCLYYLQSRYYDPTVGRFINADDVVYLEESENLFLYCANNPISRSDPSGNRWYEETGRTNDKGAIAKFIGILLAYRPYRSKTDKMLTQILIEAIGMIPYYHIGDYFSFAYEIFSRLPQPKNNNREWHRIAKKAQNVLNKCKTKNCAFEISLLFGGSGNQFKIVALYKRQVYCKEVFKFGDNKLHGVLHDALVKSGISLKKRYVTTNYYYR